MNEAYDIGSTPEDWRDVEDAEGPAGAIWLTINRIEQPAREMMGITQLLLQMAANPGEAGEDALSFLACQLHGRVALVQDTVRTGCALARPFAQGQMSAPRCSTSEADAQRVAA